MKNLTKKSVCFYSTDADLATYQRYLIQDINILNSLGYNVKVTSKFLDLFKSEYYFYFSWWATGSSLPVIISKLYGKKCFVMLGGNDSVLYKDSISLLPSGYLSYQWYKKIAVKIAIKFADTAFVVSRYMVPHVLSISGRSPIVCHNSIDLNALSHFNQSQDYLKFGNYIFSIVNFDYYSYRIKRVENLLKAYKITKLKFPDLKLVFAGRSGVEIKELRKFIANNSMESDIFFLGLIPNSDIWTFMKNSKMYVQPSDTETFGQAVLEALSFGVPVVVSRCGALPEICSDFGFYVNQNDPISIANKIQEILMFESSDLEKLKINSKIYVSSKFTEQIRCNLIRQEIFNQGL